MKAIMGIEVLKSELVNIPDQLSVLGRCKGVDTVLKYLGSTLIEEFVRDDSDKFEYYRFTFIKRISTLTMNIENMHVEITGMKVHEGHLFLYSEFMPHAVGTFTFTEEDPTLYLLTESDISVLIPVSKAVPVTKQFLH
jgi:hypothetical protein